MSYDEVATAEGMPFGPLVGALRQGFIDGATVPQRQILSVDGADSPITTLLMPAWSARGYYGVKIANVAPNNRNLGLPAIHATYTLFDAATGQPVLTCDGGELTARRTVSASALAASYLARSDASHLLIVGAGRLASLVAHAYAAVRTIEHVSVWARRPDAASSLAETLRADGFEARPVADLPQACANADIVSAMTLTNEPLLHGSWLHPGSHLDLMGSFTPDMQEAANSCFVDADVFVDTSEALVKSGDLINPIAAGLITEDDIAGDLASLCRGYHPGRTSAEGRTVFKSVGTALEDLAAAELLLR